MDASYHYPPELLQLLVDTIPRLSRSKADTILFFRGAGTPETMLLDVTRRVQQDPKSISKYEIARTVLVRLNEGGDTQLRVRRELLKRVTEFEDFSRCWPNEQMQARGLVTQVQRIVNVKDSFTRMNQERQQAEALHRAGKQQEAEHRQSERAKREAVAAALFALFAESDASRRGKALEAVLNELFALDGMLVKEAFTLRGKVGDGVIEQIDGVIRLDGHLYLVEMKWWGTALGPGDVAQHLVRLYQRSDVRGLFISYTDFTVAALQSCTEALHERVVTLAKLQEIVEVVQSQESLATMLRAKTMAAVVERRPYVPYTVSR